MSACLGPGAEMDSGKPPRLTDHGDVSLTRDAIAGLPLPGRFVRSQVDELRRADHKLNSLICRH